MAYKTGDLKYVTKTCLGCYDDGECYEDDHYIPHDMRANRSTDPCPLPVIFLPHSCDQWVIGGVKELRTMISDLQTLLEILEPEQPFK